MSPQKLFAYRQNHGGRAPGDDSAPGPGAEGAAEHQPLYGWAAARLKLRMAFGGSLPIGVELDPPRNQFMRPPGGGSR